MLQLQQECLKTSKSCSCKPTPLQIQQHGTARESALVTAVYKQRAPHFGPMFALTGLLSTNSSPFLVCLRTHQSTRRAGPATKLRAILQLSVRPESRVTCSASDSRHRKTGGGLRSSDEETLHMRNRHTGSQRASRAYGAFLVNHVIQLPLLMP